MVVEVNICWLTESIYITTSHQNKKKKRIRQFHLGKYHNDKRHPKPDPQIKSWIETIEVEVSFRLMEPERQLYQTLSLYSVVNL